VPTIEVNPAGSVGEWRTYVESHPDGLHYHLPEWQAVLADSLGHEPFYVFARNEAGALCGVLPLFHVKSILTGRRLVSLPFASACGPIADSPETTEALVNRAKDLCRDLRCRYLEIRMTKPLSLGLDYNEYYSTYVVPLYEPQLMWKGLEQRARGSINKGRKRGVVVRIDNSERGVEAFYHLNLQTKTRLGVPAHPLDLFKVMRSHMGSHFQLYLAEVEGKVISGAIAIRFNGVVAGCYQASDSRYLQYHPNDAVTWQELEDGSNQGYRCFDFGKTASDNLGLAQYKMKFRAEERKLYYGYYPKMPNLASSNRKGIKFGLATNLWRRLPLPLARALGSLAFRQLD
jgi:FemAB-related protein (PEP-CTERM system-associated)